jgi:hypothetical protein
MYVVRGLLRVALMRSRTQLLKSTVTLGMFLLASCLSFPSPSSAASRTGSTPETIILPSTLSNMQLSPAGVDNGPLTPLVLSQYIPNGTSSAASADQALADGQVSGYVRHWSVGDPVRNQINVLLFKFTDNTDAQEFVTALDSGLNTDAINLYPLSHVSGGRIGTATRSNRNTSYVEHFVTFAKGPYAVSITTATSDRTLTASVISSLAIRQAGRIPASAGSSMIDSSIIGPFNAWKFGQIVFYVLLGVFVGGLVIIVVQRRQSRKARDHHALNEKANAMIERVRSSPTTEPQPTVVQTDLDVQARLEKQILESEYGKRYGDHTF